MRSERAASGSNFKEEVAGIRARGARNPLQNRLPNKKMLPESTAQRLVSFVGQVFNLRRICNPPVEAIGKRNRPIENRPQAASLPH